MFSLLMAVTKRERGMKVVAECDDGQRRALTAGTMGILLWH